MTAGADPLDTFAAVARALAEEHGVEATLQRVVDLAVDTVPGAQHAGISKVRRRKEVTTVASTKDVPDRIDALQYETGQGPCLDAIFVEPVVRVDDLSDTDRWPHFAARAAEAGVLSMASFRLFVEEDTAGALNLYNAAPRAFDESSMRLGHVFAAHAALAWNHEQDVTTLQEAVDSRTVIGQAQGMLMALHRLSADEAFDLLRRASQQRNVKLRDVARSVVEAGGFPPEAARG